MLFRKSAKAVSLIPPAAAVNGAAFTSNVIDRAGFNRLRVFCHLGAVGAAMTALKLRQSDVKTNDTTLGGTVSDVSGAVFGTSLGLDGAASTLPAGGAANTVVSLDVDLATCKRYVQLAATAGGANTFLSALALLEEGEVSPETAAERGVSQGLFV